MVKIAHSSISEYIKKNTEPRIRSRGETIYRTYNGIDSCNIEKEKGFATYMINGQGGKYIVYIRNFNDNISSSCTCPYDYHGVCKHEVAALLHLQNKLGKGKSIITAKPPSVRKRSSEHPYYIVNYESLSGHEVFNHCMAPKPYPPSVTLIPNDSEDLSIEFNVKEMWGTGINKVRVHLHLIEGLGFTCSCHLQVFKLCEHASEVLKLIFLKDKTSFILSLLQPAFIENKKKEILKEYGLSENVLFEDYFKLTITLHGIIASPANKGIGLQRIKSFRNEAEAKIISTFNEFSKQNNLNLPLGAITDAGEDVEVRKIGYVLIAGGLQEIHPALLPISGKPGKSGTTLASHIRTLDKIDANIVIKIAEDDKILMALAGNLTGENAQQFLNASGLKFADSKTQTYEQQKFYLEKLKQIIPLLEKQPYIYLYRYYRNIPSYMEIRKSDLIEIKTSSSSPALAFHLFEKDNMVVLQAQYRLGENFIDIIPPEPNLNYPFLFTKINNVYHLNNSVGDSQSLALIKNNPIMKVIKQDLDNFFDDVVKPIAKKFPVTISKISGIKNVSVKLAPLEKQLYISEMGNYILFKPFVKYNDSRGICNPAIMGKKTTSKKPEPQPVTPATGILVEILNEAKIIEKSKDAVITFERDLPFEQEFIAYLQTLHPLFAKQYRTDFFHLPADAMLSDNWFFSVFQKLNEENIEVFGFNKLKSFNYSPFKAKVTVQLSSGEDWFDVNVKVVYGDLNVDLKDIQKAVLRNENYIKLSDGTTGILPAEWFEKFKKYFNHGEVRGEKIQISKLRFSIIDELFDNIDYAGIFQELAEKKQKMLSFKEIKSVKTPNGITAQLRDYQKEGLNWLNFLQEFHWGGILADDMGLGKTLQTIAFLTKVLKKSKKTNLIVMPTSLMFNWENEIKKFAPNLKAMVYHGNDRVKDHSLFAKHDLVFTTYGLMARDIELFKKYKFHYIVLDESQAIKNPLSQRYKAACLLRAENRIALTGTPIENNTFDLFAQMNFLNPGFLGNPESFKKKYAIPIDRDRNEQCAQELQRLINPFIIRRTKEQVEKDLPEKTEDILYCTMESEQQKVYDAFRNKYRNYLLDKIEEDGLAKSKIYVLEGLLKLRQICDSPAILSDEEQYCSESVKIKELLRHINEKTGKHKILVFSQFVKMLQLIKNKLNEDGISYEYLDGKNSIQQRQDSVNHFQTDEKCRVFLISLKAGGMGINLTAADYVYIVDPWWNPAVENQAIDRCHRIGQNKKVIAYRMICKNTVEEKILTYQAKKKQIASDIIQTDDSFMKSITQKDIEYLFE